MGLKEYHRKRNFDVTAEPAGAEPRPRQEPALSFVVQKHAARRLHYDFRLELDGVLKSWAVPKGPSSVPGDKRLAVEVEDHPLEYADFEGIIPKGEYGGGTVLVWDRGQWTPIGDPHEGLAKGHLEFAIEGDKLHGRWRLVRLRKQRTPKPSWLLLKSKDADATAAGGPSLVDAKPLSVVTGRDLAAVAADQDRVWHSKEAAFALGEVAGARRGALPDAPEPQLATLVTAPPSGAAWLHEVKLDGYRLLARLDGGQVRLITRHGLDWTARFPGIAEAVAGLPCRAALLDGEAVVLDADGRSSFQALQGALGSRRRDLVYFAFDLLHVDGMDLTGATLEARKSVLARLLAGAPASLHYADHTDGDGAEFLAQACAAGLEGVVSKRRDARYRSGRGKDWLKAKCVARQELVVVGFTEPGGRGRVGLGALLLAVRDGEDLVYAGKVGTGFSDATLRSLRARLDPLVRDTPAVTVPRADAKGARWVAPELVAEVSFTEWTKGGVIRHPVFQGLREDKPAAAVVREQPAPAVKLSHPDKVLFPDPGITKRELAQYYESIAEFVLPGLMRRPLTLVRCPEGYDGQCFYQKRAGPAVPRSIPRVAVDDKPYVMIDSLGALLSLVQIGVLELHVWGSRAPAIEQPDILVFDLDPDPSVTWPRVVATARHLDGRLRELGLAGFPRVTGGKGLHVVVPVAPSATWDEVKEFTHQVALWLVREDPDGLTANMAKARRAGKIFVDYLRNAREATAIASYSTRRQPGAPIAMPLAWDQLGDERPVFPLREAAAWVAKHGDPWPGFEAARRPLR